LCNDGRVRKWKRGLENCEGRAKSEGAPPCKKGERGETKSQHQVTGIMNDEGITAIEGNLVRGQKAHG